MDPGLWELASAIADARDSIEHAERLAHELSGDERGQDAGEVKWREPCPTCNGTGAEVDHTPDTWMGPAETTVIACPACNGVGSYEASETIPEIKAEPGWPAMLAVVDRLAAIRPLIDAALGEEVATAIKAEGEENDRYDSAAT